MSAPHSLHGSHHKARTCLRGRDTDSTYQWKKGKFLEESVRLEILLQPLLEKTISQVYQQFTDYPRGHMFGGLCGAALGSRRTFWGHPPLTTPWLRMPGHCLATLCRGDRHHMSAAQIQQQQKRAAHRDRQCRNLRTLPHLL